METFLSDGVCILPRLADGESDHLLRLCGIKLRLRALSRHYHANLGREVARIFSVSNIDKR
jgi:hypothetical protein